MADAAPAQTSAPRLDLPHQVIASMLVPLILHALPSDNDAMLVAILRDEVLPVAARGASPLADRLIGAAEGLVSAHGGRTRKGEPSLRWSVSRGAAEAVLDQYFTLRAAQGLDRLRATTGGSDAA